MRLRRALAVGLLVGLATFSTGCTKVQMRAFLKATHQTCEEDMPCWDCHLDGNKVCGGPQYCPDDKLWSNKDHRCDSPNQWCRSKYGPDAHAVEDKNGDIGCYKVK